MLLVMRKACFGHSGLLAGFVDVVGRTCVKGACRCTCGECGAPAYIAWSGKRQWMELLNIGRVRKDRYAKLEHGLQHMRPDGVTSESYPASPVINT